MSPALGDLTAGRLPLVKFSAPGFGSNRKSLRCVAISLAFSNWATNAQEHFQSLAERMNGLIIAYS
jgi:hypothetical protein